MELSVCQWSPCGPWCTFCIPALTHVLLLCSPSALITVWKLLEQRPFQHWQHSEGLMAGSPGQALSSSLRSKINCRDEGHGQSCGLFPAPLSFGGARARSPSHALSQWREWGTFLFLVTGFPRHFLSKAPGAESRKHLALCILRSRISVKAILDRPELGDCDLGRA